MQIKIRGLEDTKGNNNGGIEIRSGNRRVGAAVQASVSTTFCLGSFEVLGRRLILIAGEDVINEWMMIEGDESEQTVSRDSEMVNEISQREFWRRFSFFDSGSDRV
ncbi:unnamed protein product [Brassica oleracea var. botrytis]